MRRAAYKYRDKIVHSAVFGSTDTQGNRFYGSAAITPYLVKVSPGSNVSVGSNSEVTAPSDRKSYGNPAEYN
jgi:hypothetical protein